VKTKKEKQIQTVFTLLLGLVLMFSYFQFDCAPPPPEETEPEISEAQQDSIRQAELKNQLIMNYSFGFEDYKNKEYAKAIRRLLKVNELDLELNKSELQYPNVYGYIANSYVELGKPDSALWAYEQGLQYRPNDPVLHEGKVYVYTLQGNEEGLVEEYKVLPDLVEDEAKKIDYLYRLKSIYINRGDIEGALEVYDRLLEVDPENRTYIDDRLTLLKSTGNANMYIRELEEKHAQYPEDPDYMWNLIVEYDKNKESDKVIAMVDKLLALQPKNLDALEKKAYAYQNKQQYRNVVNVYNQMLEIKPNEKKYFVDIAQAYISLKDYATARSYVRRAQRIDSDYGYAYMTMGNIYEACAEEVVREKGGYAKLAFDDKLVYKLAYDEYAKAANDFEYGRNAQRRMNNLKELIPKDEDYFMHPNQKEARGEEYAWIYK